MIVQMEIIIGKFLNNIFFIIIVQKYSYGLMVLKSQSLSIGRASLCRAIPLHAFVGDDNEFTRFVPPSCSQAIENVWLASSLDF